MSACQLDRAAESRADEAQRLGQRLLEEPHSPRSRSQAEPPAVLLRKLKSTVDACNWLLARWLEFAAMLDLGVRWGVHDLLRLIRLLGKQPLDAVYDSELNTVVTAFERLWPGAGKALLEACKSSIPWRTLAEGPKDIEGIQQFLLGIIRRNIDRLAARRTRLENSFHSSDLPARSPVGSAVRL
jgi:hypothetical protein